VEIIHDAFVDVPQDMIRGAINAVPGRMQMCFDMADDLMKNAKDG
jgi:hypothetical protein